jgi:hypothetical protein
VTSRSGSLDVIDEEDELTAHGLYRAEHRALRELYRRVAPAERPLGAARRADRRPTGDHAAPRRRGRARAARRAGRSHLRARAPRHSGGGGRGQRPGPHPQRRRPAARAQSGDAHRGARDPARDNPARLPRPAGRDAGRRGARRLPPRPGSCGCWRSRARPGRRRSSSAASPQRPSCRPIRDRSAGSGTASG